LNWKVFKSLPPAQKGNEIYYIIGLDIGNDSSAMAFYNVAAQEAELIDPSGGYARPTTPTAMQYIAETKEWVYGEYAIINQGLGREISDLVSRLGNHEYIDVDGKPISLVNLLGLFIKELMSNVKNINPKAEIAGIVCAVPSYLSVQAREELSRAFKNAGYEKELIGLFSDRECILAYQDSKNISRKYGQRILLIDYGARAVRGGIYFRMKDSSFKSASSLFDETIGTSKLEKKVKKLFTDFYKEGAGTGAKFDKSTQDQLSAFTYQHRDILFQKAIRGKAAKLYFNFAFPPFSAGISAAQSDAITSPFRKGFDQFILQILGKDVSIKDIDQVICVGGGFEMLWVKEAVSSLFPQGKLHLYKNSKGVTAMGAAVMAARLLDVIAGGKIEIEDRQQLAADIGISLSDGRFIPLAECNSFWWQAHPCRLFIVNSEIDGDMPFTIQSRTPMGEYKTLLNTSLQGLPDRPKGTTRLKVQLKFESDSEAVARVVDYGFGELFPRVEFEREIGFASI